MNKEPEFFELEDPGAEYPHEKYFLIKNNNKYMGWSREYAELSAFTMDQSFLFGIECISHLAYILEDNEEIFNLEIIKLRKNDYKSYEIIAGPIPVIYYLDQINEYQRGY